jgi:outer membrane protein TolC
MKHTSLILSLLFTTLTCNAYEEASAPGSEPTPLALKEAVTLAIQADPWLAGNQYQQQALNAQSIAGGTLPDPTVSIAFANLPVNSFDFSQEPMTQFKVGITQMLPRGESRALQKQHFSELSEQMPLLRENRRGELAVTVASIWLAAYRANKTIELIENNRTLFEQLVAVTEAKYASALGATRQHDVIRAQLELTRLDDRLTVLRQQYQVSMAQLQRFINPDLNDDNLGKAGSIDKPFTDVTLEQSLPDLSLVKDLSTINTDNLNELAKHFFDHPLIRAITQREQAQSVAIELAKQSYRPMWGINASYGYRDESPNGMPRDDFFSIGVTFDLPLFTENRQDQTVAAAVAEKSVIKTQRWQKLREFIGQYLSLSRQLMSLNQRLELYKNQLLPQMRQQAEAALSAYNNDDGDFADAIRARIAELEADIQWLNLQVEKQNLIIQINYLLSENADSVLTEVNA